MTTALELISSSLRLANILGEGQTASADQGSNALEVLNDLLDALNVDSLALYQTTNDQVLTVPGQSLYTIGTGGNWTVDRPVQINSAYIDFNGVSFPVAEVNQDEYNLITLKGMQGAFIPRFFLYLNTFPLGTLTLWPTPSQALTFTMSVDRVLANVPLLATSLTLPPGYKKMLRALLAVELCPEYGREPSPTLAKMARESLAAVKRSNHVPVVSEYDPSIIGAPAGLAAFLSGY
jgi:hypothetical protein